MRHESRDFDHYPACSAGRHGPREGRRFARGAQDDGHDGRPHRHGRHGGRNPLGRFFEHGDLRLLVLQLVAERPRHGYDIIKAIEEKASGAYTPSPGVIYPTLTLLEEMGLIAVTPGDGARKVHSITAEGTAHLGANKPALDAILARIEAAGPGRGMEPQILRAMENLKLALRLRLSHGQPEEASLRAIAAAIDAAAVAVEQS